MATRRERVIVEADDRYSRPLAGMAASTSLFSKAMADAEKQSKPYQRAVKQNAKETNAFSREAAKAGSEIDRLSGRMRIWLDMAVLIGPAFLPIGAIAVPAVMGLANAMGAAALGAGAIAAALPGVGDAVKALSEFRDDPSAANAEKLAEAFEKIGPDAREFAVAIQRDALPALRRMRDEAAAGGLPWLTDAIGELEEIEPRVSRILRALADATGEEIFDAAESFNTERWDEFFTFLETEVPGTISDVAAATGNLTHGLAEMWMAFAPTNDDFGNWLVDTTADFDAWSQRLESTDGFHAFVAFLEETGPKVEDFAGSLVDATVQIADAIAPFSGPTLTILTKLLDGVASIADSDLGTPLFGLAAGLAAVNRAMRIAEGINGRMGGGLAGALGVSGAGERQVGQFRQAIRGARSDIEAMGAVWGTAGARTVREQARITAAGRSLRANLASAARGAAPAAAGIGALALTSSGAADSMGLANAASLALMGTMVAPGWGTAIGGAAGLTMDLATANNSLADAIERADKAAQRGSVSNSVTALRDAQGELTKYTEGISQGKDLLRQTLTAPLSMGVLIATGEADDFAKGIKNQIEGIFGSSDIEEETRKYQNAAIRASALQSAVRGLAAQMRTPITGTAEQQIARLDEVLASAQPAMAELGISTEEYAQKAALAGGVNPLQRLSPTLMARAKEDLSSTNAALATTTREMDSVSGRTNSVAAALAGLDSGFTSTAVSASKFAAELNALLDPEMDQERALLAWKESLASLRGDLAEGSRSFSRNTEAGRQNRNAILDRVDSLKQTIAVDAAAGVSSEVLARRLQNGRRAILDSAAATGLNRAEVRKMVNELNLTPRLTEALVRVAGDEEAKKNIAELQLALDRYGLTQAEATAAVLDIASGKIKSIQDLMNRYGMSEAEAKALLNDGASGALRSVIQLLREVDGYTAESTITTTHITRQIVENMVRNKPRTPTFDDNALGGFHGKPMADGGYQPMMLGSGPTLYMWREPETKGESFIPHANDHRRPRAKSILEQTASLFGGSVVWNALGGVYGQGRMQPITVNAGSSVARMTGTAVLEVRAPWGSEEIEVQMREIARDEIDGDHAFRYDHKQG